ncbi:MAG: response regulator, partial [Proteobacteria bacterium]
MKLSQFKILVVEDDAFFRDIVSQCLQIEGAQVLEVDCVENAKKSIPFFGPNLILSDVQMPGGTGMDLLEWINRSELGIPVIIMTGFSELADAASAAEAGASGFLAKPFQQSDLVDILVSLAPKTLLVPLSTGQAEAVEEQNYLKISVEDLMLGSQINHPLFLKMPQGHVPRFVKIAHNGEDLPLDQIRLYKTKGIHHLYLTRSDYLNYVGLAVQVTQATHQNGLTSEKCARLVRDTLEIIEHHFSHEGVPPALYHQAYSLVESNITLMTGTDSGCVVLESIREISDELYAHSAAVSLVSTIIARQMGWTSPKTLHKVAMAGMLH